MALRTHDSIEGATQAVEEAIGKAMQTGRWMVAVWSADELGNVKQEGRTTWKFPREGFLACVGELTRTCMEDAATASEPKPLPRVKLPSILEFPRPHKSDEEPVVPDPKIEVREPFKWTSPTVGEPTATVSVGRNGGVFGEDYK